MSRVDVLLPHDVPGAGLCDRDKFNGDLSGLQALWGATQVTKPENLSRCLE